LQRFMKLPIEGARVFAMCQLDFQTASTFHLHELKAVPGFG
jgi:hypothetical protein